MHRRIPCGVAVAALLLVPAVRVEAESSNPSIAERAYIAAELYAAAQLYFAHWEAVPGLDLAAAYRAYLDQAMAAPDRVAFDLATLAFVAQLRNGHTSFWDSAAGGTADLPLGFEARPIGREWVVTRSRVQALRTGDVISAVDGEPVEKVYERYARYVSASSERAARAKLFSDAVAMLFPARLAIALGNGRSVTVDRTAPLPPFPRVKTEGRWIREGDVAYLRVPSFDDASYEEEALRILEEFRGARALVLDVRGNGGGNTPTRLIGRLMNRPARSWTASTPMTVGIARAYRAVLETARLPEVVAAELRGWADFASPQLYWPSAPVPPQPGAFGGKLLLLVDIRCASSCEDFVVPFKDNHRATILGETTAGTTGQPYVKTFPNGMGFRIGAKRERMPDGSPFEGVGIQPDVSVETTAADLRSGKDLVLERALRIATSS